MSENFKGPFKEKATEKKAKGQHQQAKEQLAMIQEKIEQAGGSAQLVEKWKSLQDMLEAGKTSEVLGFLENISFRRQENVDAWRKAIYQLSWDAALEIAPLAETRISDFMQEEFQHYQIIHQEQPGTASLARKLEIIEAEIRNLYQNYIFLKNSIKRLEAKQQLAAKEKLQLHQDRKLLDQIPADLHLYRKVRNSIYRIYRLREEGSTS